MGGETHKKPQGVLTVSYPAAGKEAHPQGKGNNVGQDSSLHSE